jgi:hypothetical protein
MATTTNYSWSTPDDVSLVKDGASAIRTLGSSADTTVKALNPGTTAGDIDYYTTSTAKARVGIGTAGQVLKVNSGATAPEWATIVTGGMTLLSTTTLSGASTTISAISQDYKDLQLVIRNYKPTTDNQYLNMRFNGDTATRYGHQENSAGNQTFGDTSIRPIATENDNSVATGLDIIDIFDYTNTVTMKMAQYRSLHNNATTTSNYNFSRGQGFYNQLDAITSITLLANSGDLTSGTALLYGVK